jgi:hypothetical protein
MPLTITTSTLAEASLNLLKKIIQELKLAKSFTIINLTIQVRDFEAIAKNGNSISHFLIKNSSSNNNNNVNINNNINNDNNNDNNDDNNNDNDNNNTNNSVNNTSRSSPIPFHRGASSPLDIPTPPSILSSNLITSPSTPLMQASSHISARQSSFSQLITKDGLDKKEINQYFSKSIQHSSNNNNNNNTNNNNITQNQNLYFDNNITNKIESEANIYQSNMPCYIDDINIEDFESLPNEIQEEIKLALKQRDNVKDSTSRNNLFQINNNKNNNNNNNEMKILANNNNNKNNNSHNNNSFQKLSHTDKLNMKLKNSKKNISNYFS